MRTVVLLAVVCVATIACDRTTKRLAERALPPGQRYSYLHDTFRLEYVENRGAFLGLGSHLSAHARFLLFTVGAAAGLILVGVTVARGRTDPRDTFAWALILAGGGSNLADRVLRDGLVVDFLNLGIGSLRTGIFNVADVAITGGAVLVLLGGLRARLNEGEP